MHLSGKLYDMPWCERGDLNPHGYPLDPKSSASANSATLARVNHMKIVNYTTTWQTRLSIAY